MGSTVLRTQSHWGCTGKERGTETQLRSVRGVFRVWPSLSLESRAPRKGGFLRRRRFLVQRAAVQPLPASSVSAGVNSPAQATRVSRSSAAAARPCKCVRTRGPAGVLRQERLHPPHAQDPRARRSSPQESTSWCRGGSLRGRPQRPSRPGSKQPGRAQERA